MDSDTVGGVRFIPGLKTGVSATPTPQIKAIFDNGGESIDRYTIVTNERAMDYYICLCISNDPDWPLGASNWGKCVLGDHLGKKIDFTDLPENVQKHVLERMEEE